MASIKLENTISFHECFVGNKSIWQHYPTRNCVFHVSGRWDRTNIVGGHWKPSDYVDGFTVKTKMVDGDMVYLWSFTELIAYKITKKYANMTYRFEYVSPPEFITDGIVLTIENDKDLLLAFRESFVEEDDSLQNGNYEEGFFDLPRICEQIRLTNPDSVAKTIVYADGTFKGCCIAFDACLKGFVEGCRPLIGLDGCHMRGKYKGVCLSMTALDGNNGLFPVAIYLCQIESNETWDDFLSEMKPHISKHPSMVAFISDGCKGIYEAVSKYFPMYSHRGCFRHIYKNFKKAGFNSERLEELTWGAAKEYLMVDHRSLMDELEKKHIEAYNWLINRNVPSWSRAYFSELTCSEHITNNFSESFNSWIKEIRDKPYAIFVNKFHKLCMTLMFQRSLKASMQDFGPNGLVPRVLEVINRRRERVKDWIVHPSTLHEYSVAGLQGDTWTVNLAEGSCECRVWHLTGIPCIHAVCVLEGRRCDWVKYCNDYLSVKKYADTYARGIRPLKNQKFWGPADLQVKIPTIKRLPGRPKNNRIRGFDEGQPEKKQRTCRNCGEVGHNTRSCKGPRKPITRPPRPPPKSKGGRPIVDGSRSDLAKKRRKEEQAAAERGEGSSSAAERGRGRGRGRARGRGRSGRGGRGSPDGLATHDV